MGVILGMISTFVINYGYLEYFFDTFFIAWFYWTITLAIVLPAILDDDFYAVRDLGF